MAINPVLKIGDPRLLQVSQPVAEFDTPALHALVQDLHDTSAALHGAGLAAPQIGVGLQVVIFGGTGPNPRYPNAELVPSTVLVNPILTPLGDETDEGWEGCLSVPGLRGVVQRHTRLRYQGFDPYGNLVDRSVNGFHARVVQHEVDHLLGILFPMRMKDMRRFGFTEVLFPGTGLVEE